jgi:hypothetical protein
VSVALDRSVEYLGILAECEEERAENQALRVRLTDLLCIKTCSRSLHKGRSRTHAAVSSRRNGPRSEHVRHCTFAIRDVHAV